jgi:glutamine cyclotransferase
MPAAREYLLTGKRWRHLYHVRLEPARAPADPARLLTG